MNYNTAKPKLVIPEYGRNVQTLIEYAKTLEDREERQAFIEKVIDLMQQMHPQARNVEDYRARLWAHVVRIGNYELDVDIPENVTVEPLEKKRPHAINYPDGNVKFRHYGRNVQEMIKKAIEMEDEEKQAEFVNIIGAYMKMAYKSWNLPLVNDETILKDLKELSGGQLEFAEDLNLDNVYIYKNKKRTDTKRSDKRGGDSYRKDSRRGSSSRGRDNRSSSRGRDNRRRK